MAKKQTTESAETFTVAAPLKATVPWGAGHQVFTFKPGVVYTVVPDDAPGPPIASTRKTITRSAYDAIQALLNEE